MPCGACLLHKGFRTHLVWAAKWESYVAEVVSYKSLVIASLPVQHLIEKCLIFRMSKEECMEALSKHANIKPVITSTVWNELEKENREYFKSYSQCQSQSQSRSSTGSDQMSEAETS
ncbi:putative DNA replication complex GINS protein PSF3 [Tanacetum coccineum]